MTASAGNYYIEEGHSARKNGECAVRARKNSFKISY